MDKRWAAVKAESEHEQRLLAAAEVEQQPQVEREEVPTPTLTEWIEGRFWREWVGTENKEGTKGEKESIFRCHLRDSLGNLPLDQIDMSVIQEFKASLAHKTGRTGRPLSQKYQNNILAVLGKALSYAEEVEVIAKAPRVRLHKVERPKIVPWSFDEYQRLLQATTELGMENSWLLAVLLAGDAGLRIGEILELAWRDVDLVGRVISVERQRRRGQTGSPKGRTRRTVPMSPTLYAALRRIDHVRVGPVVCQDDGMPVTEGQAKHVVYRICRKAGLPARSWHSLRHTYATNAARFSANPWSLQRWMGHKRIDETMLYVDLVEEHPRPIPEPVLAAGEGIAEPDARTLAMLGALSGSAIEAVCGNGVATQERPAN